MVLQQASETLNFSLSGSGMEVMHRKHGAHTLASELVVRLWRERGRPPIDAQFLAAIQKELTERFGNDAAMSPASVARLLADEGAELRHPQIIEFDVHWRESLIKSRGDKFAGVEQLTSGARLNIEEAIVLFGELEKLRQEFECDDDDARLDELRTLAVEARQRAEAMGKNRRLHGQVRLEQSEIAEWLKVWLQTPMLFENWLELRRRSEEFRLKFGHGDRESQRITEQ